VDVDADLLEIVQVLRRGNCTAHGESHLVTDARGPAAGTPAAMERERVEPTAAKKRRSSRPSRHR
jgi:hypothetical protein